ncbi:hypothetical protein [Lentibacillus jeotgali]|nr:hypothetical protein [Lentibacillus jeotgali]
MMKQILMTLFIGLVVSFGIVGYFQTTFDTDDVVEKEESDDNNTIILN